MTKKKTDEEKTATKAKKAAAKKVKATAKDASIDESVESPAKESSAKESSATEAKTSDANDKQDLKSESESPENNEAPKRRIEPTPSKFHSDAKVKQTLKRREVLAERHRANMGNSPK